MQFLFVVMIASAAIASDGPKAVVVDPTFKFEKVLRGSVVEHEFSIRNEGNQPLAIKNVMMSTPLRVLKLPATVEPGGEAKLRFSLDTSGVGSFYEGVIVVTTSDPVLPEAQLTFDGNIVSTVEISPMPAFYLSAQRGERKEVSVEIINHEQIPLTIESIENPSGHFVVRSETIEEGMRYRLVLTMNPDAPLGKSMDVIRVRTSSQRNPVLQIGAHTYVRDRVYTFPQAVEFGELSIADLRNPGNSGRTTQRLVIYESGGTDFKVQLSSDLPFLRMVSQRAPTGDRFQVFVSIDPAKVAPGDFNGTIQIVTNDSKVSKLTIPITIAVRN